MTGHWNINNYIRGLFSWIMPILKELLRMDRCPLHGEINLRVIKRKRVP
jgi:hypothetical protein